MLSKCRNRTALACNIFRTVITAVTYFRVRVVQFSFPNAHKSGTVCRSLPILPCRDKAKQHWLFIAEHLILLEYYHIWQKTCVKFWLLPLLLSLLGSHWKQWGWTILGVEIHTSSSSQGWQTLAWSTMLANHHWRIRFCFLSSPKHGAMEQHIFVWALRFLSFLLPHLVSFSLFTFFTSHQFQVSLALLHFP